MSTLKNDKNEHIVNPSGVNQFDFGVISLANVDISIRHGFILKVFGIVAVQLLITLATVGLFMLVPALPKLFFNFPTLYFVTLGIYFACFCALVCNPTLARTVPTNYICLLCFTLATSIIVGMVTSLYPPQIVFGAVVMTVIIVLALAAFAVQTKYDFTSFAPYVFILFISMSLAGIVITLLVSVYSVDTAMSIYAAIGVVIFSLFLVFDIQMIIGGRHKYQFGVDDYVYAALNIYLDIINLFLEVLRLLGGGRK